MTGNTDHSVRRVSRREAMAGTGVALGSLIASGGLTERVLAQTNGPTDEISGTVEDESGAVEGATVVAVPHDTSMAALQTTTAADGTYIFAQSDLYEGENLYHVIARDGSEAAPRRGEQNYPFVAAEGPAAGPDAGLYLDGVADNKLTGRDSYGTTNLDSAVTVPDTSQYSNPSRPEWSTVSGSPTATNETIQLDNGEEVSTAADSGFSSGPVTWETDYQVSDPTTSGQTQFWLWYQDADNWWRFVLEAGSGVINFALQKTVSGSVSNAIETDQSANDTNTHTAKAEYDGTDSWEIFLDGTSIGTATDSFQPTANEIRLSYSQTGTATFDNLRVF